MRGFREPLERAVGLLAGGHVAGACEDDTPEIRSQMGTVTFADGGRADGSVS